MNTINENLTKDVERLMKKYANRYNKKGKKSDRYNKIILRYFLNYLETKCLIEKGIKK